MEELKHFTHRHPLSLVYLNPDRKSGNIEEEEEEEDGDEDDFYEEEKHGGQCNLCKEQIYSFHLCYYQCKPCDYSLHKFCAELPEIQNNHPLHPGHNLILSERNPKKAFKFEHEWMCHVCKSKWESFFNYYCKTCNISMDIICATISQQKINHLSHPDHQLERMFGRIVSICDACGEKHDGHFFQCIICPRYRIHMDCALLPAKLLIQHHTNENYTHSHRLSLAYSFPFPDKKARFHPRCRVCDDVFYEYLWIYKCDKCLYYVHVYCATSKRDAFVSILQKTSLDKKTLKNYKDDEHPNLLHCPFSDEGDNLLKHLFFNQKDVTVKPDGEIHQHPLNLFDTQTSLASEVVSLHDPMRKIQLLCDGCVKPITTLPFYKCSQSNQRCDFILHEWCAKLPPEVQDYAGHPNHKLVFLPKVPHRLLGVFFCPICELPSNGFAYGCMMCEYYVCINCAFIPEEITHEAHPGHLLSKANPSARLRRYCKACKYSMKISPAYNCPSCDIYIHVRCALLLPRVIRHKYDKHPLSLRYEPAENHISEYFCEICEDELTPWEWFYHCGTCDHGQSMHAACAPLILQCEQATYSNFIGIVFKFLNIKFGRTLEIKGHSHRLAAFVQGIKRHGNCIKCHRTLQYQMIFKCLQCKFAIHCDCADSYVAGPVLSRSVNRIGRRGFLMATNFEKPEMLKDPLEFYL